MNLGVIDFPANPTVGTVHTHGDRAWRWDGVKWVHKLPSNPLDSRYVERAGDTMTGPLTLFGNPRSNLHAVPYQMHRRTVRINRSLAPIPSFPVQNRADTVMCFDANQNPELLAKGSFPPGPQGPQGPTGATGATGPQGAPGNYLGLDLYGADADIANRPDPATVPDNAAWGLINGDGTLTLYLEQDDAWLELGTITAPLAPPVANTIFLSEGGDDANSGRSIEYPVATMTQALTQAQAMIDAGGTPPCILVYAGTYYGQEYSVPDGVTIRGATDARSVVFRPTAGNEISNCFLLGSGCKLESIAAAGGGAEGFQIDDLANPTKGFLATFRPDAVIFRPPYLHNCVMYHGARPSYIMPALDRANGNPEIGHGGGVILADGNIISRFSLFPNILAWGATPISFNGIGYVARGRAFVHAVNAITMWARVHYMALDGGTVLLSACASQFGDYIFWSQGSRALIVPKTVAGTQIKNTTAADAILAMDMDTFVDDIWASFTPAGGAGTYTADQEAFTKRDAKIFLKTIAYAFQSGSSDYYRRFVYGFFDNGLLIFDPALVADFKWWFQEIHDQLPGVVTLTAGEQTNIQDGVDAVNYTLDNYDSDPTLSRLYRSQITAISHQWTYPLAGVSPEGLPPEFGGSGEERSVEQAIVLSDGGNVTYSGQGDNADVIFAGDNGQIGLKYDAKTRRLVGIGLQASIRSAARQAAIVGGSF